jgi:hypothetical protein
MRFRYANDYQSLIKRDYLTGGVNFKDRQGQFKDILDCKQQTVESYYPTLVGTKQYAKEKFHEHYEQPLKSRVLRPSTIGTVRLPLESV